MADEQRRRTVAVYIDGFNLYRRLLEGQPQDKWLDVEQLAERVLSEFDVVAVRYFTAIIKPLPGKDPRSPQRQQAYVRALRTLPRTTIFEGKFRIDTRVMPVHPVELLGDGKAKTAKVKKTEEKGSDVALASMLLLDAMHAIADCFVVLSNDSDLVMPIRMVKADLGRQIGVLSPVEEKRASNELKQLDLDLFRRVPVQLLAECQLPDAIRDEHGTVRRPPEWARNSEGPA
jgi:hypothetical protein